MKYKTLFAVSHERLEERVNDLMKEGYMPQGGVCFNPQIETLCPGFTQAMIKE